MRNNALIVDDVEFNRELLSSMLEDEYGIIEAGDGEEALALMEARADEISVVLLDLVMPKLGGIDVLKVMTEKNLFARFPVLIITGESAASVEEECLKYGISDFVKKPFNPAIVLQRVRNAEALFTYRYHLEEKVAEQTEQLRAQAEDLRLKNIRLEKMNEDTIELLSDVVEARNMESGTHVRRVKAFTQILAEDICARFPEYGLDDEKVKMITIASPMHDIGKIMISDNILLKPGKFTPEEFDIMKSHTVRGCELLERSRYMWDEEYFNLCWQVCRYHHEKVDGRGYPEGLKGDEIPIAAQIVSVADCYDALTTERVYKRAFTADEAYDMISGGQCGAFSDKVMESFKFCREKFATLSLSSNENDA